MTAVLRHLHVGAAVCPTLAHTYAVLGEPKGDITYVAVDACPGRALWDSGTGTLDRIGLQLLDRLIKRAR